MWQEDVKEDVRSCWMTLRAGEDTLIWRRRLWIALCGGIVLEEALDLSSDRLLNNNNNARHKHNLACTCLRVNVRSTVGSTHWEWYRVTTFVKRAGKICCLFLPKPTTHFSCCFPNTDTKPFISGSRSLSISYVVVPTDSTHLHGELTVIRLIK